MFGFFSKALADNKNAYDYEFIGLDGNLIKLSDYKDKVIVVVNVASRCGYTPQYEDLQSLWSNYKEKDLIVATGDLGAAYLGLQILEREKAVFMEDKNMQPDLMGSEYVLERQLKPEARKDIVEMFKKMELKPTSMIDVSDGLSSELLHLAKASNLGLQVYEEKIPVDPTVMTIAEEFNLNGVTCALNGGEDYELLFTIAQNDYDKIKGNPNMTVIGYMTDKNSGAHLITHDAKAIPLSAHGWNSHKED